MRYKGRQRVSAWEGDVQRGGGALLDALVKESGWEKAPVNNCGRTQSNYGLVAVEELDLKESTVDLVLHPASSRCLSLAW